MENQHQQNKNEQPEVGVDSSLENNVESPKIPKTPEEIDRNNKKIEDSQKSIETTQNSLDKVRAELGIPTPADIPPSVAAEMNSMSATEKANESLQENTDIAQPTSPEAQERPEHNEVSPEMAKFKQEMEAFTETVAQIKHQLSIRTEYDLSELFSQEDTESLGVVSGELNSLDVYTDHDFEKTTELLNDTLGCINSIESTPRGRGGINDDPESLQSLTQKMADLAGAAENIKASAQEIGSRASAEVARISEELAGASQQAAAFLDKKREALEAYLG